MIGGLAREGCFLVVVVFLIAVLVGAKHLLRDVDLLALRCPPFLFRACLLVVDDDEAVAAAVVVVRIVALVALDRAVIDDGAATVVSDGGACFGTYCHGRSVCPVRESLCSDPNDTADQEAEKSSSTPDDGNTSAASCTSPTCVYLISLSWFTWNATTVVVPLITTNMPPGWQIG